MQLEELFDYKNLLMKDLCKNDAIVKLVTGNAKARVPNHDLAYSQIFPFEFVPETEDESRTFICFDVDILRVPNKTFYIPALYIWVFAHKSKLRMSEGRLLLDTLSAELDKMLNGNRYFGLGDLKLYSVTRFAPITDYRGRCLTYSARDFNRPSGIPKVPSNRKAGV